MARDADALLLQVSADISKLQKQFAKAIETVDSGSKKMEDRAKRLVNIMGGANDNAVQKLSRGIGTAVGDNIRDLANTAGQASTVLDGFGAAGVAAAAAVGALVVVLGQAKAAVAFGDAIADQATKVGVSTDTLQEYRYAIHQLGGDYDDADAALSSFTQTLGKAQLGFSKKALKPFAALGLSKDDLNDFKSADEALKVVLDRLAGIKSESERQGLASALGLEKFIPLAREGSGKLDELRAAAHRLGYVMSADLVAKAGEANDKLEDLQAITDVQLKSAFVDLAPVILQVAQALADAAREVNKIASDIKDAMPVLQKWFGWLSDANKAALDFSPWGQFKQIGAAGRQALGLAADAVGRQSPQNPSVQPVKPKLVQPFTPIDQSGGAGPAPRDMNVERTEQINALLASTARDLLQAQSALTGDIEARSKIEREITAQQLAQDLARLNKSKADLDDEKGISDATRTILKARIDEAAVLAQAAAEARIELIKREEAWAIDDRADETRRALLDAEIDSLQLQADLARTQEERTAIERQILKLRQDELLRISGREIARLEETDAISEEEGARRYAAGAQQRATERAKFDLDHEGPLKAYLRGIQDLNTEMQNAGVTAIESLSAGLADAALNARSLGGVASNVFRQLIAQLLESSLKKSFSNLVGGLKIPGFASGTESAPAGWAWVGENGPELRQLRVGDKIRSNAASMAMMRRATAQGVSRGGPTITATFAPTLSVGAGADAGEVAQLRAELARMKASFKSDVTDAVNDGIGRRTIRVS